MNETLTVLNSINEKLGLIVEAMNLDQPAYVKVAKQTLAVSNAKVEEIVPAVQEKEEALAKDKEDMAWANKVVEARKRDSKSAQTRASLRHQKNISPARLVRLRKLGKI